MKTLFIILVLMAAAYLLVPKSTFDSMSTFLPSQKIEQAAKALLSNVDEKLDVFKQNLTAEHEQQLSDFENKIAQLEKKVAAMELLQSVDDKGEEVLSENEMPTAVASLDTTLAHKPELQSDINAIEKTSKVSSLYKTDEPIVRKEANKAQIINRQASLQDIAERMNRTSLMALTK